ncbi:Protein YdcF [Penicillium rolfsii]|nr:Protein YdcF [Penicillium rolfsii]
MATFTPSSITDINTLAEYLSDCEVRDLSSVSPVDCIVLCASQVLYGAEMIFAALQKRPGLTKCLVLCGGTGHSTDLLYRSVGKHPRYSRLIHTIQGLPEARVLERILDEFFDRSRITAQGCRILIEEESTNCGQNASESRQVLSQAGFTTMKRSIIIQDPTMMLRTKASFERAYKDAPFTVSFLSCPVFVPKLQISCDGVLQYQNETIVSGMWTFERFIELIMGEIPRLRDDEEGYGPRGRDFISHVNLPSEIQVAWSRLAVIFRHTRPMSC